MNTLIQLQSLSLRYKEHLIWDHVDVEIFENQVVALVGLNGSGKTSLLQIIAGLQNPSSGHISGSAYAGSPSIRHSLLIPAELFCYDNLTVSEMCGFYCELVDSSIEAAQNLQVLLGLDYYSDFKVSAISFGTKVKLGLCLGFMSNSPLLLVDELFNGLDPVSVEVISKLIRKRTEMGSVLVSSHSLELVESVADRILLIKDRTIREIRTSADRSNLHLRQLLLDTNEMTRN